MKKIVFSLMVPAVLAFTAPAMAAAKTYEVTIQNVTSGISFTNFKVNKYNEITAFLQFYLIAYPLLTNFLLSTLNSFLLLFLMNFLLVSLNLNIFH